MLIVKVLHTTCHQIWKAQQWPQDWKRSVFTPIPKKGNAKMFKLPYNCLISHASKVMLKVLQDSIQQYMNQKLPDVQTGFRKCRITRDQIANICWIIEKAGNSRKTSTSASLTTLKPLTVWITTNWKILKRWEYHATLPLSCVTCMQVKTELYKEQWTGQN